MHTLVYHRKWSKNVISWCSSFSRLALVLHNIWRKETSRSEITARYLHYITMSGWFEWCQQIHLSQHNVIVTSATDYRRTAFLTTTKVFDKKMSNCLTLGSNLNITIRSMIKNITIVIPMLLTVLLEFNGGLKSVSATHFHGAHFWFKPAFNWSENDQWVRLVDCVQWCVRDQWVLLLISERYGMSTTFIRWCKNITLQVVRGPLYPPRKITVICPL